MRNDIHDMGSGVYVVHGKAVKLHPGAMDISTVSGQDELIRLVDSLYIDKFDQPLYGCLNVCWVGPKTDGPAGSGYGLSDMHVRDLPEHVRQNLRKEFPEYASEI